MSKIAVFVCGLCNTDTKHLGSVYGMFEHLKNTYGHQVDYFLHLWDDTSPFPDDFVGRRILETHSYIEYIPTENIDLQNKLIDLLKPKGVIRSSFSELYYLDYYKQSDMEYISYVNTTAQFYAFEKLLRKTPLIRTYDFIFRWRYDIATHHYYSSEQVNAAIEKTNPHTQTFISNEPHIIGGHKENNTGVMGMDDRWFGINKSTFRFFENIHKRIYKETIVKKNDKYTYIEECLKNVIYKNRLHNEFATVSTTIIRPRMNFPSNFSILSFDDQTIFLDTIPSDIGPDHANVGYK